MKPDQEYCELIAEISAINRELVESARALPAPKDNPLYPWVVGLDPVIEKHRRATARLRELVLRHKRSELVAPVDQSDIELD